MEEAGTVTFPEPIMAFVAAPAASPVRNNFSPRSSPVTLATAASAGMQRATMPSGERVWISSRIGLSDDLGRVAIAQTQAAWTGGDAVTRPRCCGTARITSSQHACRECHAFRINRNGGIGMVAVFELGSSSILSGRRLWTGRSTMAHRNRSAHPMLCRMPRPRICNDRTYSRTAAPRLAVRPHLDSVRPSKARSGWTSRSA